MNIRYPKPINYLPSLRSLVSSSDQLSYLGYRFPSSFSALLTKNTYSQKKQTPKGESDDYGDGGVDVTGAPNATLVEGANDAFLNQVFSSEIALF